MTEVGGERLQGAAVHLAPPLPDGAELGPGAAGESGGEGRGVPVEDRVLFFKWGWSRGAKARRAVVFSSLQGGFLRDTPRKLFEAGEVKGFVSFC